MLLQMTNFIFLWLSRIPVYAKQYIKKQRYHFANKGPYSRSYHFSSSHVQMWEVYYKEDCCCCCTVASVVSDPVQPHRRQPTRYPVPGNLQARTLESEPKNWYFQTVVLEKTLENPLDRKEVKPVNPKENQHWIFTGRTVAKAEAPVLGHLMQRADKDPNDGKDWRQKAKGVAEDKVVKYLHWHSGHESEQTPGDSGGQRSLRCYSLWGCKKSDTI